jgi:hypothetical protein
MEIHLQKTPTGLVPLYDTDFEEAKKLKNGTIYKAKIVQPRNIDLHRKYFALINCAWEYLNEAQQQHYANRENFRKTVEIAAGHFETCYSLERKEWLQVPKSISFSSMKEFEFRDLYTAVKDVIFSVFLRHVSFEDFEKELIHF